MGLKVVRSSHLALRFYVRDGWTSEDLKPYLISGAIDCTLLDESPYWRLSVGSKIETDRLFKEQVAVVVTYDGKRLDGEAARLYMREFDW